MIAVETIIVKLTLDFNTAVAAALLHSPQPSIEIATGRVPNSGSHPRPVFGCDCCILVKKPEKTDGKMQSNCEEGYFAGLESYLFLIKVKDSNEIFKVSKRRVRTMERQFCKSLGPAMKDINRNYPQLDDVEPHALPSVLSAREKEEKNAWFAGYASNWRDLYLNFVNKNFCDESVAAEDGDLASDENDIDLEVGKERDEPLAGPVLRSSGEPNLPKNDGWKGDEDEGAEEQEEQDGEGDVRAAATFPSSLFQKSRHSKGDSVLDFTNFNYCINHSNSSSNSQSRWFPTVL